MAEAHAPDAPADGTRGDESAAADAWVLLYLGFPTIVFLVGWIRPQFGIPAALAMAACLVHLARRRSARARRSSASRHVALIMTLTIAAVTWTFFAGIGHFVYANDDWVVRDAVLHDLVERPWPVVYDDARHLMLRAPLAFYLPAAVIGKAFGLRAAELGLFAWTSLGVALVFWLMFRERPGWWTIAVRLLVFVLFSGMDIVGYSIGHSAPPLGEHLEWWATLFQYSSQTTLLFWVPNHALPGWIAIAWLLAHRGGPVSIRVAIVVVACIPLWSPLTALGVLPIFAAAMAASLRSSRWRTRLVSFLDPGALIVTAIFCVLVGPYIVLSGSTVPLGVAWTGPMGGEVFALKYVEFVVLEFGLLVALLRPFAQHDGVFRAAVVVLLVLPFFQFGAANDLVMRASIGPLALLAIRCGEWLVSPCNVPADLARRVAAVGVLAIGSVTPVMEFARTVERPTWPMDTRRTLVEVTGGHTPHYFARRDQAWPRSFLK